MSAREVLGGTPRDHRHHGVVVQVQEADLVVLFAQREEHRVQQLGDLGQEVHVATAGDLCGFGLVKNNEKGFLANPTRYQETVELLTRMAMGLSVQSTG